MVGMIIQFLSLKHGVINNLMALFGFERIDFVSKAMYFRFIYIFSDIWQGAGFSSIIYIAVLSSIDPTLYEAATIDGATKFKKVWHIDIPSLMPTIIVLFILNAGQMMNVGFEKMYLMQNPLNSQVTEVISTYIYKVGLVSSDYGYSTAIGLFNSVINMILLVGVNKAARATGESSLW
jgi:putative aldouronate transport system permease protein